MLEIDSIAHIKKAVNSLNGSYFSFFEEQFDLRLKFLQDLMNKLLWLSSAIQIT